MKNTVVAFLIIGALCSCKKSGSSSEKGRRPVNGGVIEGNSGEYITNEHNPWFIGPEPVTYCIKHDAARFSLQADAAAKLINDAFSAWRGILENAPKKADLSARFIAARNRDVAISTDYRKVGCDEPHEFEVHLGVTEDQLRSAMKYGAEHVAAVAFRTDYDDLIGRARGTVWFSPDLGPERYQGPKKRDVIWADENNFFNVAMHELGHVMGVRHREGTFMDENVPARAIQYGFDHRFDGRLLEFTHFDQMFCGTLRASEEWKATVHFEKILGTPVADIAKACFGPAGAELRNNPYHELQVHLRNQEVKKFLINDLRDFSRTFMLQGHYLANVEADKPRYLRHIFRLLKDAAVAHGVVSIDDRIGTVQLSTGTTMPGLLSISLGVDGRLTSFHLLAEGFDEKKATAFEALFR